jgi:hypothetical protein
MAGMFFVEKYVPLPEPRDGYTRYPLDLMDVTDSFFAADADAEQTHRIRTQANYHKRKYHREYTVRQVPGGIRVWRVA